MPELPEVEHVRRTLIPHLVGQRLESVLVRRASVIEGPRSPHALLVGGIVARIDRRGKQLALVAADGRVVCIHLGMSGQVLCEPPNRPSSPRGEGKHENDPHVHIMWITAAGTRILFRDPRRFGGLWPLPDEAALTARWSALGPDALLTDAPTLAAALAAALRGSRRAVKAALLDQAVLAGVGNIYADEACHIARIRPGRASLRITLAESTRLAEAIRTVLARAVVAGGSTLRDYVDADGRAGTYRARHAVYGRGHQPCLRCGKSLRQTTIAQRTTVHCTACQR